MSPIGLFAQAKLIGRRAAEGVLMAFGVPVTPDMPVDAVFVASDSGQPSQAGRIVGDVNPATGLPMATASVDVGGFDWGTGTLHADP